MKRRGAPPASGEQPEAPRPAWVRECDRGLLCRVRVTPNASANEVTGIIGDALGLRLTAPPVEGKANKALVRFVADRLGLPRSAVSVVKGHAAREKTILITGTDTEAVLKLLG